MATTTPNYGWSVPTSTDLVKDGATAIETLGDSVDATVKALNPETTLGDIAYRSATANTNTRLAIGTSGQILSVNGSGVPEWTTPAAAAGTSWTLLNAGGTALTGAQTISVSGISSKNDLFIVFTGASSASAQTEIRIRFNGDAAANYQTFGLKNSNPTTYASTTTFNEENQSANNHIRLAQTTSNANSTASGYLRVSGANTSGIKMAYGVGGADPAGGNAGVQYAVGGSWSGSATVTSVAIISEFGNFDAGTIFVYTSA
jgi:filamentous hemagglutinin family protein